MNSKGKKNEQRNIYNSYLYSYIGIKFRYVEFNK